MPIQQYGVWKGHAVARKVNVNNHYQIHGVDDENDFRVAVNVQSDDRQTDDNLLFLAVDDFQHPVTAQLEALKLGFTPLHSQPGGEALDYIRDNLFDPSQMRVLPPNGSGPTNDLNDALDQYVQRAFGDQDALIYAFGARWGPESKRDKVFGFRPGNGIHDVHMNQGNAGGHAGDDGVWQDGALLLFYPRESRWAGLFLAFQSQAWHTDDRTGHQIAGAPIGLPTGQPAAPSPVAVPPAQPAGAGAPDGIVRIVAAVVAPSDGAAPSVTLLNATPDSVNLDNWAIADSFKRKFPLAGALDAGTTVKIDLGAPLDLRPTGGILTLINADGLKVDGVSYTRAQTARPGWTIVF